jgi:hypothetical protein
MTKGTTRRECSTRNKNYRKWYVMQANKSNSDMGRERRMQKMNEEVKWITT